MYCSFADIGHVDVMFSSVYLYCRQFLSVYVCNIFRRVRKISKSDLALLCLSVCPSFRIEQLGSHLKDFHEI